MVLRLDRDGEISRFPRWITDTHTMRYHAAVPSVRPRGSTRLRGGWCLASILRPGGVPESDPEGNPKTTSPDP